MRIIIFSLIALSLACAQNEFILGADISHIPSEEARGIRYTHNGQQTDIFDILSAHKFNYIRLRLFVDPTVTIPNQTCESGGWCPSPYSTAGYCDFAHTLAMAKRIKAAGMKFLLDFHYSDTWADPGKQYKPVSWADLSFAQLTAKVRSYTKETLEQLKEEGALPDMVQVGNEVVGGMIWPDGRNSNWASFGALMNAGIDGVKDVDADIKIMAHTINERNPSGWLSDLKAANRGKVSRVDVLGLSYYPEWHGDIDSLRRSMTAIANNHSDVKIVVVEYDENHRAVNDAVFNLQNRRGIGTFVWEPTNYGPERLFTCSGNRCATNERIAAYPQMAAAYAYSSSVAPSSSSNTPSSSSGGSTPVYYQSVGSNRLSAIYNGINLQATGDVSVKIYDLKGYSVAKLSFTRGVHAVSLAHLPKGMYIVRALYGAETKTLRLTIM